MSAAPVGKKSAVAAGKGKESADPKNGQHRSQVEPPPWESPHWQEAVSQNPGLAPFFDNLESFVELPEGVEKLRALVLDLAVRGKLVEQDEGEESAEVALERILAKKEQLAAKAKKRARPNNKAEIEPVAWQVPSGWAVAPLSDLLTVINGRAYKKDELLSEGTPVLRVGNLFTSNHWYYSDLELEPEKYCDEGDLIFAWSASFGPFIWPGPKAIYHYHIWKLQFHSPPDIERDYLHLFLQQKTKAIKEAGHGVSMVHMTKGKMELLEVPLPPLAEQRRIVSKVEGLMSLCDTLESQRRSRESVRERASRSVLASLTSASALDSESNQPQGASPGSQPPHRAATGAIAQRLMNSTETLKSSWQRLSDHFEVLLDQPSGPAHLRQSILQLAVQGKLVPQDPNDEPVAEFLEEVDGTRQRLLEERVIRNTKTKDTVKQSLDCVPNGWDRRPLSDLCRFIDYRGKTPTRTTSGVRLITAKNVRMGSVNNEPVEFVTEKQYHEWMTRGFPEPGDLLFVTEGHTMGFVGMLDLKFRFTLAQRTINLQPYHRGFNVFLFNYLMSPQFQHDVFENATGSAAKLKQLFIAVPPLAEQKRIVSKVSVLLSQLDELSARLRSRQSTTDALLTALIHQILNGANSDGN